MVAEGHDGRRMLTEMPLPLGQFERERHVRMNCRECLGEGRIRFPALQKFDDSGLHALCESGGIFLECFVDIVERAESLYELRRDLFTDALDAGNVVRRIAAKRLVINDVLRSESVPLRHRLRIVEDGVGKSFAQGEYAHTRANELQGVHVACRNNSLDVFTRREFAHDSPHHIIGLEACVLIDGNAERLEYFWRDLQLGNEFVLGLYARGLVRLEEFVSLRLPRQVARGDNVIRLEHVGYFEKHEHEAVKSTRGFAL